MSRLNPFTWLARENQDKPIGPKEASPLRFSRSGRSHPLGKLIAELPKIRVSEGTRIELERRANAADMNLSEYIREVLLIHVHGKEAVMKMHKDRLDAILDHEGVED